MEVSLFISLPMAYVASEQAILAEQQLVAAFPGAELEQAAISPQVVHGLKHHIADEGHGHVVKNTNAPFSLPPKAL